MCPNKASSFPFAEPLSGVSTCPQMCWWARHISKKRNTDTLKVIKSSLIVPVSMLLCDVLNSAIKE